MNDRFQYRAKDVKTGEWRYGYYTELPCGLGSSGVNGEYADTDAFILNYTKKQSALYSNAEPHEVVVGEQYKIDEKTLSQCTGLKDKNKKLVYEGDIVRIFNTKANFEEIRLVTFKACAFQFNLPNSMWVDKPLYCWAINYQNRYKHIEFEVIGNIYENPELLEEQCANQLNRE